VLIPTASGRGAFATELLVQNYNRRSILSTKMRFVRIITLLIVPPVAFRLAAIRAPKPVRTFGCARGNKRAETGSHPAWSCKRAILSS
jgi:hypothetical protein